MTEHEWLSCSDPAPMLASLRNRAGERKVLLYCSACLRRSPRPTPRSRRRCEVAERFADGLASARELRTFWYVEGTPAGFSDPERPWEWADRWNSAALPHLPGAAKADLLRDIFGPLPFRAVALDPSLLTSTVVALARQMYESREFGAMPILADALQDAGCDQADILAHCRGDNVHVRGCWVVDLVLGKA